LTKIAPQICEGLRYCSRISWTLQCSVLVHSTATTKSRCPPDGLRWAKWGNLAGYLCWINGVVRDWWIAGDWRRATITSISLAAYSSLNGSRDSNCNCYNVTRAVMCVSFLVLKRFNMTSNFWIRNWSHIPYPTLPPCDCTVPAQWRLVALDTIIVLPSLLTYLLTHLAVVLLVLLVVVKATLFKKDSSKSLRLCRFKSDRDEIWQDCSSSKYTPIDGVWCSTRCHTFKMADMRSFTQKVLPITISDWTCICSNVSWQPASMLSTVPDL